MKRIFCLLTVMSLVIGAYAQSTNGSGPGYRRPGTGHLQSVDKFLNGGEKADDPENVDSADAAVDTPAAPAAAKAPAVETPKPESRDRKDEIVSLVEQSVAPGVFIIRQGFGYVDKEGTPYVTTVDNEDTEEFGSSYSLGIYLPGGYLFFESALTPWQFDPSYEEYKSPDLFGNLLGNTSYAYLGPGSEFAPIAFDKDKRGNVYPGYLYSMRDNSPFADDGMTIGREAGEQEGYIVWIVKKGDRPISENTDLMLMASKKTVKVSDDPAELYKLDYPVKNAVGCMFVVPDMPRIGQVNFILQGVGVQQADGKWSLIFPFADPDKVFDAEQAVKAQQPADQGDGKRRILKKKAIAPKRTPAPEAEKPAVDEDTTEVEAPEADKADGEADKADTEADLEAGKAAPAKKPAEDPETEEPVLDI